MLLNYGSSSSFCNLLPKEVPCQERKERSTEHWQVQQNLRSSWHSQMGSDKSCFASIDTILYPVSYSEGKLNMCRQEQLSPARLVRTAAPPRQYLAAFAPHYKKEEHFRDKDSSLKGNQSMDARRLRVIGPVTAALFLALWAVPVGAAGYRTNNFSVAAPTPQLAKEIGDAAEHWRRELAHQWLGHELPIWSKRCPINARVAPTLGAGGATSFVFDRGEVFD